MTFRKIRNPSQSGCNELRRNDKNTLDNANSAEIVKIGTKDDFSILIKIGDRNYKTLWDSGAGCSVISIDNYKKIPVISKTEIFESDIKIKAASGLPLTTVVSVILLIQ